MSVGWRRLIRDYHPDVILRDGDGVLWIVETKGREDVQDARKWHRLKLWCHDATEQDAPRTYRPLFVREEEMARYQPRTASGLEQGPPMGTARQAGLTGSHTRAWHRNELASALLPRLLPNNQTCRCR